MHAVIATFRYGALNLSRGRFLIAAIFRRRDWNYEDFLTRSTVTRCIDTVYSDTAFLSLPLSLRRLQLKCRHHSSDLSRHHEHTALRFTAKGVGRCDGVACRSLQVCERLKFSVRSRPVSRHCWRRKWTFRWPPCPSRLRTCRVKPVRSPWRFSAFPVVPPALDTNTLHVAEFTTGQIARPYAPIPISH